MLFSLLIRVNIDLCKVCVERDFKGKNFKLLEFVLQLMRKSRYSLYYHYLFMFVCMLFSLTFHILRVKTCNLWIISLFLYDVLFAAACFIHFVFLFFSLFSLPRSRHMTQTENEIVQKRIFNKRTHKALVFPNSSFCVFLGAFFKYDMEIICLHTCIYTNLPYHNSNLLLFSFCKLIIMKNNSATATQ